MGFDLAQLDTKSNSNEGKWLTLKHPDTGEELPLKIRLAGVDSDIYKNAQMRFANARIMKGKELKGEHIADQAIAIAVECTLEWEGFEENGKPLAIDPVKDAKKLIVEQVYKKYPVIFRQVDKFVNDETNFLGNVEKKSVIGQSGASG